MFQCDDNILIFVCNAIRKRKRQILTEKAFFRKDAQFTIN